MTTLSTFPKYPVIVFVFLIFEPDTAGKKSRNRIFTNESWVPGDSRTRGWHPNHAIFLPVFFSNPRGGYHKGSHPSSLWPRSLCLRDRFFQSFLPLSSPLSLLNPDARIWFFYESFPKTQPKKYPNFLSQNHIFLKSGPNSRIFCACSWLGSSSVQPRPPRASHQRCIRPAFKEFCGSRIWPISGQLRTPIVCACRRPFRRPGTRSPQPIDCRSGIFFFSAMKYKIVLVIFLSPLRGQSLFFAPHFMRFSAVERIF